MPISPITSKELDKPKNGGSEKTDFFLKQIPGLNFDIIKDHGKHLKVKYFSFVKVVISMEGTGIVYECLRCSSTVPSEELELRGGEIKCIICGYRILKKVKPPVVRRIKAR